MTDYQPTTDELFERLTASADEAARETREGRHDAAKYARYASDPCGFAEDVLGAKLWEGQRRFLESVRDHRQTSVRAGVGQSKDFTNAILILWFILAVDGFVLVTSSTEAQVSTQILRGEVRKLLDMAAENGHEMTGVDSYASRIDINGRTRVVGRVTTEISRLTGYHFPRVLGILSESSGIPSFAMEALDSCAVGADDKLVATGNPRRCSGWFFDTFKSAEWNSLHFSAYDLPQGADHIPGTVSTSWIDKKRREAGGEDDPFFRISVLGEFPEAEVGGLVTRELLDHAATLDLRSKARGNLLSVALDPAGTGPDKSVVCIARLPVVERFVTLPSRPNVIQTADDFAKLLLDLGVAKKKSDDAELIRMMGLEGNADPLMTGEMGEAARITVDRVGLGDGIYGRLVEQGFGVIGFRSSQRAKKSDLYVNARAEAYVSVLRSKLERGELQLPHDERLFSALLATTWSTNSTGKIVLRPKDDIREDVGSGAGIDEADALVMALYSSTLRPSKVALFFDA
jgi:hypothetical protein